MNKHGLSRNIPAEIRREVRRRSKFGCVICRAGVFDYEHIDPAFKDAVAHDPDNICCLCSSCHDKVTRNQFSKEYVRKKYQEVDNARADDVTPPFDSLDFHDGKAELQIGGISYDPGVNSIVRYHGTDYLSVRPTDGSDTAGINAVFLDELGKPSLRIEDNVWSGEMGAWDTEVVGPRIGVRRKKGIFDLRLRLEPPGRIVIERLNMRVLDAHILVSEETYAAGRYGGPNKIYWYHAQMVHIGAPLQGAAAIEFVDPFEAALRDSQWNGTGQRLASADNQHAMQTGLGVACKPIGVIIGANCLKFGVAQVAYGGPRALSKMREVVFNKPDKVARFIGTGEF